MGVGAPYARAGLMEKMPPFMSGGDMIGAVHDSGTTWADGPRKLETGTRKVVGELGFTAAIDYMQGIGWEAMETHEQAQLDRMLDGMRAKPWLTVYGEPVAEGRYGVVSVNVNDVHPHECSDDSGHGRHDRACRASLRPAHDGVPGHRQMRPSKHGDLLHTRGRGRPAGKS